MIIDRTNNQIKPSVSSTNLVTPDPRGSASKSGASSGKMIQPRTPIGAAASAQIPRIFAREYCSLCLSLGGPCTVDSLSLGPRFSLMEGCSPLPEPYFLVRLHYMASLQWCKPHQVHSLFTQVPRRCVLGSSVVLTAFSTMGAGASVGSVGKEERHHEGNRPGHLRLIRCPGTPRNRQARDRRRRGARTRSCGWRGSGGMAHYDGSAVPDTPRGLRAPRPQEPRHRLGRRRGRGGGRQGREQVPAWR